MVIIEIIEILMLDKPLSELSRFHNEDGLIWVWLPNWVHDLNKYKQGYAGGSRVTKW